MEKVGFGNLRIEVPEGVFRPRQETEFWAKKALPFILKRKNPFVLDMFCGTGCVGLFVLKNTKARLLFSDSEKKCLEAVFRNADLNKIGRERFKVRRSFFFERLTGRYDFILANPPYVAEERRSEVGSDVLKRDPEKALFSGKRGLGAIRRFLKEAPIHLKERGEIFMEFDPFQKEDIRKILAENGFSFFFFKDQFGKERWLHAHLTKDKPRVII